MKAFRRREDGLVAEVDKYERLLLSSLAEQLTELLGGHQTGFDPDDPLAALAHELTNESPLDRGDPVVQRLFPDAHPDDPGANADFLRYTQEGQRWQRVHDAAIVLADLASLKNNDLMVPRGHADAWLRTLNGLRLTLSVRLDIVDEQSYDELGQLPENDPRSQLAAIYDWLGMVLESMLEAL